MKQPTYIMVPIPEEVSLEELLKFFKQKSPSTEVDLTSFDLEEPYEPFDFYSEKEVLVAEGTKLAMKLAKNPSTDQASRVVKCVSKLIERYYPKAWIFNNAETSDFMIKVYNQCEIKSSFVTPSLLSQLYSVTIKTGSFDLLVQWALNPIYGVSDIPTKYRALFQSIARKHQTSIIEGILEFSEQTGLTMPYRAFWKFVHDNRVSC